MRSLTFAGDVALMGLIVVYYLIVGADLFVQALLVPYLFSEPPRTLYLVSGPVDFDSAGFWALLSNIAIAVGIIALALNWVKSRRFLILFSVVGFIVINALSFAFVFPEFRELTATPYADVFDPELQARGEAWNTMAAIRTLVTALVGAPLLLALSRARA